MTISSETIRGTGIVFFLLVQSVVISNVLAQSSDTANEFWPSIRATFDLRPKTRLLIYGEKHNGEDVSLAQWNLGAIVSYRMKRLINRHRDEIDEENLYNLVIGSGYQYVQTDQNGKTKRENRLIVQAIPKYSPGAGFLLQDRSRLEFRWIDGGYNFRYRNKVTVDRPFKVNNFRFSIYASGELFWDRNNHSWNENQYAFGVQMPYKKVLMVDTYYLHQNCTTCSQSSVNVFGATLNFYFHRKK